ncbi:MAG: hypothetical protein QNJ35_03965 [Paracoccaceae bacterium]|nr:hypothetical protein [Paracoccaceae bacterium]
MRKAAARRNFELLTGHAVVRLLIVSYFMALSLGVISGTDVSVLAGPFLPDLPARVLTSGAVFGLAAMILLGVHRRAAALLLAIAMFWASYLTMLSAPVDELGAFWRDLALIGALILTYADAERIAGDPAPEFQRHRRRISTKASFMRSDRTSESQSAKQDAELYRRDLDLARVT